MFDSRLRRIKDLFLEPMTELLYRSSVTPMMLTITGGVIGILAAAAASMQWWISALVLWLANRVVDGIDGALARKGGSSSDLGGYMDIMADFLVYALLPLGIARGVSQSAYVFPHPIFQTAIWPAAALLLGACYINTASWMYLSALLEKKDNRYINVKGTDHETAIIMPRGIIEGSETILFYALCLLLPGYSTPLFFIFSFLVGLTALFRVLWWFGVEQN